jgi:hypothetical protein
VKLLGRPCIVFKPEIFGKIAKVMKKDWLFEKRSKLNRFAMQVHIDNGLNVWSFPLKLTHQRRDMVYSRKVERLKGC